MKAKTKRYKYVGCCVDLRGNDIRDMVDDELEITLRTFRQHADTDQLAEIEEQLGYVPARESGRGMRLSGDCYVSFHRSRYRGKRCYYMQHSAIEYVFV